MWLQMALFHSFLWLSNISWCIYTTSFFICSSFDGHCGYTFKKQLGFPDRRSMAYFCGRASGVGTGEAKGADIYRLPIPTMGFRTLGTGIIPLVSYTNSLCSSYQCPVLELEIERPQSSRFYKHRTFNILHTDICSPLLLPASKARPHLSLHHVGYGRVTEPQEEQCKGRAPLLPPLEQTKALWHSFFLCIILFFYKRLNSMGPKNLEKSSLDARYQDPWIITRSRVTSTNPTEMWGDWETNYTNQPLRL